MDNGGPIDQVMLKEGRGHRVRSEDDRKFVPGFSSI